jgi:hypothetical protein
VRSALDPRLDPDVVLEDAPPYGRLRDERDHRRVLTETERYYTALGLLLEANVLGLIREWRGGLVR